MPPTTDHRPSLSAFKRDLLLFHLLLESRLHPAHAGKIKHNAKQADHIPAMAVGDLMPEYVAAGDALGQPTPMTEYLDQRFRSYRSSLLDSRLNPSHTVAIKNSDAKQADDARAMADGDLMPEYVAANDALDSFLEGFMDADAFNACESRAVDASRCPPRQNSSTLHDATRSFATS